MPDPSRDPLLTTPCPRCGTKLRWWARALQQWLCIQCDPPPWLPKEVRHG